MIGSLAELKALIFDMDGVLIVSNPAHFLAWQRIGKEIGLDITEDLFYREFSGRKSVEVLAELFPDRFDEAELAGVWRRKEALFREEFVPFIEPVPGVVEWVRKAKGEGALLAVASSAPRENVEACVGRLGLLDEFDVVMTGSEVAASKPDPTIFKKTAELLGVRAGEAVVFEDSIPGVKAAVEAGIPCIGVTTSADRATLVAAGAKDAIPDFQGVDFERVRRMVL